MKIWDYPIELVEGSERLVDLLVRLGWCQSKQQAKRLIKQDGIKIDGLPGRVDELITPPPQGVLISQSRRRFVCIQPAYGDELWDKKNEQGEYLVDALVQ